MKAKKQRRVIRPPNHPRAEVRFLVDWSTPDRIAIARANVNAFVVRVDSTRRFTVPKAMRDRYDIQAGDEYRVERSSGDTILVFPARSVVRATTERKAGVNRTEILRRLRKRGFSKTDSQELKRAANAASKVLGPAKAKRRKVNYPQARKDLMAIGPVDLPKRK